MFEWMVSSSVLIAAIVLLRFLLRGKATLCFQYALWGLVLIRLLVPVSIGVSPVSVMNVVPDLLSKTAVPEKTPVGTLISPEPMAKEPLPPSPLESADAKENSHYEITHVDGVIGEWRAVVKVVWLIGLTVVGLFLLVTNLGFSVRLKRNRRVTDISEYPLPVYVSSLVETPCMFGLSNLAIYITRKVYQDPAVLHHVLEHEVTHYHHADHIWSILRGLCLALHWYNPLVWLAASLSMQDAEFACDEGTVNRMGEESRVAYGRSLIGLTSKKCVANALLKTATSMNGRKNRIKKRITLISKRQEMAPYTLVLAVFVVLLAACGTFTREKDVSSKTPSSGRNVAEAGIRCYHISLSNAPLYEPSGISTEPPIDGSDILEVFAEAESGGVKMLFYRARGGDIWGAWEKDGSVHRFIQAFNAQEQWGYEDGFSVQPFQDLFGRDGFVMGCSFGASYHAYDYYYLNGSGEVELLAGCVNNHTVLDLDGDGGSELLYFSYESARLSPHFYFQREDRLYQVDVIPYVQSAVLGWGDIWSDGTSGGDDDGPYLNLTFRPGGEEAEYDCKVRYMGDALAVEVPEGAISPDGVLGQLSAKIMKLGF